MIRFVSIFAVAAIAGLWHWVSHPPAGPEAGPAPRVETGSDAEGRTVREAVLRALPVLEDDGIAWLEGRTRVQSGDGCVSCHQVPFGVWGLAEAARSGLVSDSATTTDLTRRAFESMYEPRVARAMSWGPLILATEADRTVSDYVSFILDRQTSRGYWEARGQFPGQRRSLEETNAVATLWTILALSEAGEAEAESPDPERAADSVARAYAWVHEIDPGKSVEWLLLESLVESRIGDPGRGDASRDELIALQNPDGGWGWLPGEASNPLSTGQVLWALNRLGISAGDGEADAGDRAARYLLETQAEDGFWELSSALTSKESSADKDYVYAYWGTAWATIGLARSPDRPAEPS